MNKRIKYFIISFILLLILFLFVLIREFSIPGVNIDNSFGEITEEQGEDAVFSLQGQWGFSPNKFVDPGDDFSAENFVNIKKSWNSNGVYRLSKPDVTYGTYHLKLETPFKNRKMAFRLPVFYSAYKFYVNGELLAYQGQLSPSLENEKTELGTVFIPYDQDSNKLELVLQISNNHGQFVRHAVNDIHYGELSKTKNRDIVEYIINGGSIIFLLILASIFLVRYLSTKAAFVSLFLTFFFLSNSIFQFATAPGLMVFFFPGLSGSVLLRFELFFYGLGYILFYGVLFCHFRKLFFLKRVHLPLLITASVVLLSLWFIPVVYVPLVLYFSTAAFLLLGSAYFIVLLIDTNKNKQFSFITWLRFVGFFFLLVPAIHDFLYLTGVLHTFPLNDLGILIFGLTEFLILADKTFTVQTRFKHFSSEIRKHEQFADEFYGYASHELRNPIHSVIGLAESLLIERSDHDLTKDQRMSVAQIAASGMRLSNQVNDLIDFSRIRTKNLSINSQPMDIYQIIELVKRITHPLTSLKELTVENNVARETPEVYGDENRLEQILYSFVLLGLRFMETGTITYSSECNEEEMHLSVAYENDDFDNTDFEKLLHGVNDNENTLEGFENSALSLIVIKEVLKLHKTNLDYHKIDKGIEFKFSLKLCATCNDNVFQESMDMNVLVNLDEHEDIVEDVKPMTILVADDNIVDLQIMINFLRMMEINIKSRRNGQDVVDDVMESPPDLLIVDVLMPKLNGYDVCKKVREKYNSTELPIILVNRRNQDFDLMQSLSVGANDFIVKPIVGEELIARVKTHLHLAKVSSLYSKFVPKELIQSLGRDNILDMQLGDQVQQDMTVFFADIRKFTSLSESMTPKENFKFINSYLARISPIIQSYGGFIDKYIGDSIMALYPKSPDDALRTAIEMMSHIHVYNGHRANSGYTPIRIGVGIHTGNCIMGVIGDGERMQGTVISDAVNLASRIQDVTKLYGANIVISQETFVRLDNPLDYNFRFLGKAKVKGKEQTVSLFEIFDGDIKEQREFKALTKVDFETAILLFAKQQFAEAVEMFQIIVGKNPEDKAAVLFLDRAQKLLAISAGMS